MRTTVRSLFLSDLHLGKPSSAVAELARFLEQLAPQQIYLIGDVVDIHYLQRYPHLADSHAAILRGFLASAEGGTAVTYLTGNHDALLRRSPGLHYGPIPVREELVHCTADGRRLLVIHGDQFDVVLRYAPWLGPVGDRIYEAAMAIDRLFSRRQRISASAPRPRKRARTGLGALGKGLIKRLIHTLGRTERVMTARLKAQGLDGIVCGHTHHAALQGRSGLLYANCGDWVESCTALIETVEGRLEIWSGRETRAEALLVEDGSAQIGRS